MPRKTKANPDQAFYRTLGAAMRAARSAAGKSQSEVAEHLDLTFQQVQKYENGSNRIPLDRLVRLAEYLEVPISQFVEPSGDDSAFLKLSEKLNDRELYTLMDAWGAIKD